MLYSCVFSSESLLNTLDCFPDQREDLEHNNTNAYASSKHVKCLAVVVGSWKWKQKKSLSLQSQIFWICFLPSDLNTHCLFCLVIICLIDLSFCQWNGKLYYPEPKGTSLNSLFCPTNHQKPTEMQLTGCETGQRKQTLPFKKLKLDNFWKFSAINSFNNSIEQESFPLKMEQ